MQIEASHEHARTLVTLMQQHMARFELSHDAPRDFQAAWRHVIAVARKRYSEPERKLPVRRRE